MSLPARGRGSIISREGLPYPEELAVLSPGLCRWAGGRDPRETRDQPLGPSHFFLCSWSPMLRRIALLISPSRGREKHSTNFLNPVDLLGQIFHWEFKREEEEEAPPSSPVSSPPPPDSLSAGSHFPSHPLLGPALAPRRSIEADKCFTTAFFLDGAPSPFSTAA